MRPSDNSTPRHRSFSSAVSLIDPSQPGFGGEALLSKLNCCAWLEQLHRRIRSAYCHRLCTEHAFSISLIQREACSDVPPARRVLGQHKVMVELTNVALVGIHEPRTLPNLDHLHIHPESFRRLISLNQLLTRGQVEGWNLHFEVTLVVHGANRAVRDDGRRRFDAGREMKSETFSTRPGSGRCIMVHIRLSMDGAQLEEPCAKKRHSQYALPPLRKYSCASLTVAASLGDFRPRKSVGSRLMLSMPMTLSTASTHRRRGAN